MARPLARRNPCRNRLTANKYELAGAISTEGSGTPTPTPVISRAPTPAPATAPAPTLSLDIERFM